MTNIVMVVTGTEAGADHVLLDCDHARTEEVLVPVPDGTIIPLVLDVIQARHIHATGCSCTSLVAVLNGVESTHVQ